MQHAYSPRRFFFLIFLLHLLGAASAQVTVIPVFPNVDDDITICYNAAEGNGALAGVSPVYAHMGVITNLSTSPSDWKHVQTTWGVADPASAMTPAGPNLWKKEINIRAFFDIPANETVLKLAFVFRNASGSIVGRAAGGGDIFYDVYPENGALQTLIVEPQGASQLATLGSNITVEAAASKPSALALYDNGTLVASANNAESLEATINVSVPGLHTVQFVATAGAETDTSSFLYIVPTNEPGINPPTGTAPGINYTSATSVRLALYAPNKTAVYVIGDFNDWLPAPAFQMHRSVDGTLWWLDISNLTPGQQYRFQYLVDGELRIADPLSTLVLDPWNDPFIPAVTYPNLPAYPAGETSGIVSVLQTNQPAFNWQTTDYERPKKTDLVIYELLLRDFLHRHDFQTLADTLDYLHRLGVTAIELMPVSEFDGNISWGYNPAFHNALDKYYGPADALKTLVDMAHARGIAVILDVVYNQATGASPLAQLYWDVANNRPAADNPWLNPIPKHEFNVFNDFNHESAATKTYVKTTLEHWITEFRLDGMRFDLSKGFTQKNTLGSVSNWGLYDASRIAIWKDYADFIWDIDPGFYVILEHFAENTEEKELAEYGMMLWGNLHGPYRDVALGYQAGINANLSGISHTARGWAVPHLIGYMESHDEERIAYDLKLSGNAVAGYNLKHHPTAMKRLEMLANLLYTVPGPKMFWQFGEIGYDWSINRCENGTISNDCRLSPKPINWEYLNEPSRRRLHDVTASLLNLRERLGVFETTDFQLGFGPGNGRTVRLNSQDTFVFVIANIAMTAQSLATNFQHPGWWYEYYTGDSLLVNNVTAPLNLQPGEYRLYIDHRITLPPGLNPTPAHEVAGPFAGLDVYPNPVSTTFAVEFFLRNGARVQLEALDLAGRAVHRETLGDLGSGEQRADVDAATWPPGFYLLRLRDERGATVAAKLVKQQ